MRIAVADILQWLSAGMTIEQIIEDFPELNNIYFQSLCICFPTITIC
jgi:uncharacterized protein (DUF433 family)